MRGLGKPGPALPILDKVPIVYRSAQLYQHRVVHVHSEGTLDSFRIGAVTVRCDLNARGHTRRFQLSQFWFLVRTLYPVENGGESAGESQAAPGSHLRTVYGFYGLL